jgi:hypothetical protein
MIDVPTISQDELVEQIRADLASRPYTSRYSHFSVAPPPTEPAAYVLILGAGFSYGIVPLVNELVRETIGDYYYPDQDQWGQRSPDVTRKDSARFWAEFNEAAAREKLPIVELDGKGLPKNPGAAYQYMFTGEAANVLFSVERKKRPTLLEELRQRRSELLRQQRLDSLACKKEGEEKAQIGERFVNGFLRYVLDPGGEHGWGSTGRNDLNEAHIYLAALLEAQQLGEGWTTGAFCRTILTTNFDTLLQNALQMVNLLYRLTDRPEKGFDPFDFGVEEGPIHLVYAHGSILRHNPASTVDEVGGLETKNIELLRGYLELRNVITIGYSGWNDGLMAALRLCNFGERKVYWCNVRSEPPPHVAALLRERAGGAVYVQLGEDGADGFMRALYDALIPAGRRPDPMQRYRDWLDLVWNRKRRG